MSASIPEWATEIRERLSVLETTVGTLSNEVALLRNTLTARKNGDFKKMAALGMGIGVGMTGAGVPLVKLLIGG